MSDVITVRVVNTCEVCEWWEVEPNSRYCETCRREYKESELR